jgi:hypothetical protein
MFGLRYRNINIRFLVSQKHEFHGFISAFQFRLENHIRASELFAYISNMCGEGQPELPLKFLETNMTLPVATKYSYAPHNVEQNPKWI